MSANFFSCLNVGEDIIYSICIVLLTGFGLYCSQCGGLGVRGQGSEREEEAEEDGRRSVKNGAAFISTP